VNLSHRYHLTFPDGFRVENWDGRRPYVYAVEGDRLRVSVVVRNVGEGLALLSSPAVRLEGTRLASYSRTSQIRYPRLPPGELTRVNVVLVERLPGTQTRPIHVSVDYTDLSGRQRTRAEFQLARVPSRARTSDEDGYAWLVTGVEYTDLTAR